MPTVLYIQNVFSIWHRKSVFCSVIHKICILEVPRICILHFLGYIELTIYIALIIKKSNRNNICLCNEAILMGSSVIICIHFIGKKIFVFQNILYGLWSVFYNQNLYFTV